MPTVAQQIEGVERNIQNCEQRLDAIERSLRLGSLTHEDRNDLETEEKTVEKQLLRHKEELRGLRKENFKTMVVSSILVICAFAIYWVFADTGS